MTEDKIQELEIKSKKSERDILVIAKIKAQNAVNQEPSAASLAALDKATKMLAEYDARQKQSEPSFGNRIEALNYLKRKGYKIGKSKLYQDCKKGLLKLQDDGSIRESDLKRYAKKNLEKLADLATSPDDTQQKLSEKLQKEVEKLKIQIETQQFELDVKKGKYISREEFDMEFAGRVAVLEMGLRYKFQSRVSDWVELVLKDPDNARRRLLTALEEGLDEQFNEFANIKKFQVVFTNSGLRDSGIEEWGI